MILQDLKKIKKTIEFWWFQKTFSRRFSFYTTEDPAELNEIYGLRYQVYCEEYAYLEKEKYPSRKERDEYDDHSIHFLLRDRNNEIAASVRLVTSSILGLPIEKYFPLDIRVSEKPKRLAEISRLIVSKRYRKKFLLLALMRGIYVYVKFHDISHVYSVLDEKLYPVLVSFGFPYKKIGPKSVYQGLTSPYIMDIADMEKDLSFVNPPLYRYLIRGSLHPYWHSKQLCYSIH